MSEKLQTTLATLRTHENELRGFGVAHAAIFGSVARGEDRADSDIDLLVELDPQRSLGVFDYAIACLHVEALMDLGVAAHSISKA